MVIVHQMTKVASETWVRVVKTALACDDAQVLHCHFMEPRNRARIETALTGQPTHRTIANMLMPKATLRRGVAAWETVMTARRNNEQVRVLSGIRDPVARSISAVIWMADFFGHTELPLNPRTALSPAYVIEFLREMWRMVLEGREPEGTFEWLLWYLIGAYRTWFADELSVVYDVDVLQTEYLAAQAAQRIVTPLADILIYRVEDMRPAAPGYAALLTQASGFLGAPVRALPPVNTSATRRSREITDAVRRDFSLPNKMLLDIYAEPVIRHFYSSEDISVFTDQWGETR